MSRLEQMAYGNEDDRTGGLRGMVGKWLMKQALKLIPVSQLRSFHWYPSGYGSDNDGKQRVVISSNPVKYWGDEDKKNHTIYAVRHDEDGVLGLFWIWKEARDAASLLSQTYVDYHFREHALNEDTDRIQIAEDKIAGLEANLHVEKLPLYEQFNYDDWPEDSHVISGDNIRSLQNIVGEDEDRVLKRS